MTGTFESLFESFKKWNRRANNRFTHSKNSSHAQSFVDSTGRVILIHCAVESFRKTGSFSVIESKHSPAEKRVSNWINFTGRLKWLGNVLHGKSMTETFESLSSVMRQSFESLSVIQSFFHSCYLYQMLKSLQYAAVVLIRSESLSHFFRRCGGVTGRLIETVSATPFTGESELQKSSLKQPVNMAKNKWKRDNSGGPSDEVYWYPKPLGD